MLYHVTTDKQKLGYMLYHTTTNGDVRKDMMYHAMTRKEEQEVNMDRGHPYLLSYYYYKNWTFPFPAKPHKPMLDSGAFSAKTRGGSVDIDDYIAWVKRHEGEYAIAANLDVIGDPETTYENQKYMERENLKPLPAFHIGSAYKELQRYIDEGYKFIALGGIVGVDQKHRLTFLNSCFSLGKTEQIKFHGFGVGAKLAGRFPFYSIDNSVASQVFMFGKFKKNGNNRFCGNITRARPNDAEGNTQRAVYIYEKQVQHYQAEYKKLVKKNKLMYYSYFGEDITDEICGGNYGE